MESIFETVKGAVSVPEAAEFYGMPVGRSRMASCLFHSDRHPSMRLYDDHFYCFSCHAHGDVADLVGMLLDIPPVTAARRIAGDFGLSGKHARKAPVQTGAGRTKEEKLNLRILSDYDRMLRDWKELYMPASPEDDPPWRFAFACRELPQTENMLDCLSSADPDEREWAEKELRCTGICAKMAALLTIYRMEVNANGNDPAAAGCEFAGMEAAAE